MNKITDYYGNVLGFYVTLADGTIERYALGITNYYSGGTYYLTERVDTRSFTNSFQYASDGYTADLSNLVDSAGATFTVTSSGGAITQITDPTGRSCYFLYSAGSSSIVDAAGITNTFLYDAQGYITNLITPYGTTVFKIRGTSDPYMGDVAIKRAIEIDDPVGGKQLYIYRDYTLLLPDSYGAGEAPTNSPIGTMPNGLFRFRNSFHWNALQYSKLSTTNYDNFTVNDFNRGRVRNWLHAPYDGLFTQVSKILNFEREPGPDDSGNTYGLITWYDYPGKSSDYSAYGTDSSPGAIVRVLPDGNHLYQWFHRNLYGFPIDKIETFTKSDGTGAVRTNTYTYYANILPESEVGPRGEYIWRKLYSGATPNQVIGETNAVGDVTSYTYDSAGRLTSTRFPTGLTRTNVYGSNGRLQSQTDLEISRTISFSWSGWYDDDFASMTDERGLTTSYTRDGLHRVTGMSFPDGTSLSNRYTALDLTAAKDRLGNWTFSVYDGLRRKIYETNALGKVTSYSYCDCGSLGTIQDALTNITSMTYDLLGRRTRVTYPDSSYVTNVYDSASRLVRVGDGSGNWTTNYYNNQGLLTVSSNAFGQVQKIEYDRGDRATNMVSANGVSIAQTFDDVNRVIRRTYPDTGVESFIYGNSELLSYTNRLASMVTQYGYDAAGRKTSETNGNNEVVRYKYDSAGSLTNLIDGKSQNTYWKYDGYGRMTNKMDNTLSNAFLYAYDANGRLTNRWTPAKGNTAYRYDAVGSLTNTTYPASSALTYAYDAVNRLTNMVDGVGASAFGWTAAGFPASEDGPWVNDTVSYTYANRQRTGLTLQQPTGSYTNGYTYDAARRLSSLTANGSNYGYNYKSVGAASTPSTLVQQLTQPNGAVITNDYDSVGRLTYTVLRDNLNNLLNYHGYSYNVADQRWYANRSDGSYLNYTYDNSGQLKTAKAYDSLDVPISGEQFGYGYDTAWNLNYRTNGTTGTFAVNSLNELTNAPGGAGSYDLNGNLVNDGQKTYDYDDENQLIRITKASNWKSEFSYDGKMRRRMRTEAAWSGGVWVTNAVIRYVYDGMRVIQERDGTNGLLVTYTRGNDLNGSLEGAGGIGGLQARTDNPGGTTAYYFCDGNGNITSMTSSSQVVVASYRYDPFGNTISSGGGLAGNNLYRFSSKESHVSSGSYYYGYRFYSPDLQRWPNRDPITERGGINLYGFVLNNPIRTLDPFGLQIVSIFFPPSTAGNPQNCILISQTAPITGDPTRGRDNHNGDTACIWRCNNWGDEMPNRPPTTDVTYAKPCKPCKPPKGSHDLTGRIGPDYPFLRFPIYE